MSSSFVARLKKKKNRKITFVVFFFSKVLTLKEKKKNRKIILVVLFSSIVLSSIEGKENREITFVVSFFSVVLSSIEEKKNQRTISVDFFFDRASSSSSLSSSFISFEFRLVTQSSRSLFSSILKNIAIMFDALMKDVVSSSETRLSEEYLTELHHDVFSSISFTFESSSDALRSRKKNSRDDFVNIKKAD
jgi:hypothetical protein